MKISKIFGIGLIATLGLTSCGDSYFDTDYTEVLDADATSEAAALNPTGFTNGMWSWMVQYAVSGSSSHDDFSYMSVLWSTELMGEDIAMYASSWGSYDHKLDNRNYNYRRTRVDWTTFYTLISKANEVIALYPDGGTTDEAKALLGESYAVRGMSYYFLIQLYQKYVKEDGTIDYDAAGVPIYYNTADGYSEEEMSAAKGRNTVKKVLDQTESDLTKAVELLDGYSRSSKNEIDQNVAYGLLARYYLMSQQWEKAASAAKSARSGYSVMDASKITDGFMDISNDEWMWGFDHSAETQTAYASFFSMISSLAPGYGGLGYNTHCIDARLYSNIPDDDYRKSSWFNGPEGNGNASTTGSSYPYANIKFGNDGSWTMDYIFMRASEMVLIEAEALAHQGKNTEAATTLKELMAKRQPSWDKSSVSVEDVYLQRRIELWGEGFTFFDLKRLNKGIDRTYDGNNYMPAYSLAVPARDKRWTYQLPQKEMQENSMISDDEQNE